MANFAFTRTYQAPDGYTPDLTITLKAVEQPGVGVAPSPCWFEVDTVTGCAAAAPGVGEVRDPRFHDITYVWSFGDAANALPSNAAALRMPAVWKNINKAYGRRVAHVFNNPGRYTVICTAYERSTMRKGSTYVTVDVADPRVVFAGGRTIIYNPNGDNLAPYNYPGANVQTSWANVTAARNALGATTGQILFAPTATLVGTQMANNPSWGNCRIGGIDPATRPVVSGYFDENVPLIRDNNPDLNIERVVFGLRFEADWDSTTETGRIISPFSTNVPTTASYLAMHHRCEFDGWEAVGSFSGSTASTNSYVMHSELTVTNWQNYGLTTAGDNAAVIACAVTQHEDALSGGRKDDSFYNNHGCLRDFNAKSMYLGVCDFFSRNGWSAGGTMSDGLGVTANQATTRINTNGETGCSGNVERLFSEGMIWIEEQDSTKIDAPLNYVFDKVMVILGPCTIQDPIEVRHGGTTWRNVLGVILNTPSAQSNRPQKLFLFSNNFGMSPGDPNYAIEEAQEAINDVQTDAYHCTLVDLRSNANANNGTPVFRQNDTETFTIQHVENNVFEQPNRSPPVTPDDIDLSAVFTDMPLKHRGHRVGFLNESGTLGANVAPGAYFTLSYADVKTTRYNQDGTDNGAATDQAYMQAACPAHPTARHKMVMGATTIFGWTYVDPMVTFEAGEIRVYNRTGATWTSGTAWALQLDRRNALPAWDAAVDTRALTIPIPRPDPTSPAYQDATTGKRAYDDLLMVVRPSTDSRGALLP